MSEESRDPGVLGGLPRTRPERRSERRSPRAPASGPPPGAGRDEPREKDSRGVIGTVAQAAGELAQIGVSALSRALRRRG